ncbi:hypothetical protein OBBRIDRAFT_701576, partial [Obba rivulosa]
IPNAALGTVTQRHIVRIMFPALVNLDQPARVHPLTQEQHTELYNDCIRLAIYAVLPGEAGHWPQSYRAEYNRIRGRDGTLKFGTQQVPDNVLDDFGTELLRRIRAKTWGQNAFFFHQIRGARGTTQHVSGGRADALERLLRIFAPEAFIEPSHWHVDIGLEFQALGRVLWWRTDAHWRILKSSLRLSHEDAIGATQSARYSRDLACQLSDVSGFRMEVGSRLRGDTGIVYIQAYNTEKTPTYLLDGRYKTK